MQRTLSEHVESLDEKVETLKIQQYDPERTAAERHQASLDLELAEKALACLLTAYELEQKMSKMK
jgi:hypothetical protein